ncbi:MAG: rod shape-determining protein MreC [Acidobacteriota bacterium]
MTGRWPHVVVVLLLVGHLVVLSLRARGGPLEQTLVGTMAPVAQAASRGTQQVDAFFDSLRLAGALREENLELRTAVDSMRAELVRLHGVEEELQRLARLSGYQRPGADAFVADVVFADPDTWLRTLIVYSALETPRHNQPVVTDRGLVGRVAVASGSYAKVLLITDRAASASAMVRRTRRQGIIQGEGADRLLLTKMPVQSDVRAGDEVVTAGLDGIFPRGVPIGTVVSVQPTQGLFLRIVVEPAVDFGILEKVYILSSEPLPESVRRDLVDEGDGRGPDR